MVSLLTYESSGLGSSPGRGHCVVFLGKTLYSHSASLSAQVHKWAPAVLMLGVTLRWTSIPFTGGVDTLVVSSCYRNRIQLSASWATSLVCRRNHLKNNLILMFLLSILIDSFFTFSVHHQQGDLLA